MRYSMTLLTFYSEEFFGSEISKSVTIRMKKKSSGGQQMHVLQKRAEGRRGKGK